MIDNQLKAQPAYKGILHLLWDLFAQGVTEQSACAKSLSTSVATLKRKLAEANSSFNYELTQYRLSQAYHWLRYSEQKIEVISDHLGYADPGSFRRMFNQSVGMSPGDYRRQWC